MVRAELRDLKGGMTQVVTKTQELESAMEEWTEQEGLETWDEEQEDSTPRQTGFTPQQAKAMGEHLIQRQKNEAMGYRLNDMGEYEDAGAPDGVAKGKVSKKTKLVDDPEIEEREE